MIVFPQAFAQWDRVGLGLEETAEALSEMPGGELLAPLPQEEKELKRVYDELAGYATRSRLRQHLAAKVEILNVEVAKSNELANPAEPMVAPSDQRMKATEADAARQKADMYEIDQRSNRKVSTEDLTAALNRLGSHPSEKEVEHIIWECDENLDGMVDWDEFKLMFKRNLNDRTGLEPSKLYNLVQFMIYDQNGNGLISVDETCSMLYARYGRAQMEVKLKEIFGEEMRETGKEGGEVDFKTYLRAVEKVKMDVFWQSAQGKLASRRYNANAAMRREQDKASSGKLQPNETAET